MTWPLPRAVALAQGVALEVVDYPVEDLIGRATGGTLALAFDPVEPPFVWRVERIVVTTTSAAQLTVSVYAGDVSIGKLRDATPLPVGQSAIAEYPQFLTIPSGVALTVVLSGTVAGDLGTASVQYQLVRRAAG